MGDIKLNFGETPMNVSDMGFDPETRTVFMIIDGKKAQGTLDEIGDARSPQLMDRNMDVTPLALLALFIPQLANLIWAQELTRDAGDTTMVRQLELSPEELFRYKQAIAFYHSSREFPKTTRSK